MIFFELHLNGFSWLEEFSVSRPLYLLLMLKTLWQLLNIPFMVLGRWVAWKFNSLFTLSINYSYFSFYWNFQIVSCTFEGKKEISGLEGWVVGLRFMEKSIIFFFWYFVNMVFSILLYLSACVFDCLFAALNFVWTIPVI